MDESWSLSHTKWECLSHVVFIPKYRRKALYGQLRRHLGEVFRRLAEQRESRIEEGHLMVDHVHMLLRIPPKYAVSQVVGYIKGKSAIHLARVYAERKRNYAVQHFWARGYFVSTVGRDEAVIRAYIQNQEAEDKRPPRRPCRPVQVRLVSASPDPGPHASGSIRSIDQRKDAAAHRHARLAAMARLSPGRAIGANLFGLLNMKRLAGLVVLER
jgi:putative transposase